MNSDILASMLGGLSGDLPLFQTGKKTSSGESGDFMELLKLRLTNDGGGTSERIQSNSANGKANKKAELNPLFAMAAKTRFANDKAFSASDRAESAQKVETARADAIESGRSSKKVEKQADAQDSKEVSEATGDDSEDGSTVDAAQSEASATTGEVSAAMENLLQNNPELAEVLAAFSAEDKAALIEAMKLLSPQDLENLTLAPEEFQDKLLELIKEMPESESKNNLLALVESEEFSKLLDFMVASNQAQPTNESGEAVTESKDSADISATPDSKEGLKASIASDDLQKTSETEADITAETGKETGADTEKADGDKDSLRAGQKDAAEDKLPEAVIDGETVAKNDKSESLREEFKRVNQPTSEQQSEAEVAKSTADDVTPENRLANTLINSGHSNPVDAKAAVEEVAKKFLALLGEKSGASTNEKTGPQGYSANGDVFKRQAIKDNGAGNGSMGNGFSSQSGNAAGSMTAMRQNAPAPAANAIFAEMLEKAEFLKTQNGSKVLNIELDPEQLGKIEMELTSRDGTVSAKLMAESTMAKARLDELAPQIKEQLMNQGVNLSEITVDISSRNPDERNSNQMSGGKNKSNRISASGNDDAEAIIRKNVLPNLRRAALNIKAVDVTV